MHDRECAARNVWLGDACIADAVNGLKVAL
jgi:hypothetical protein